MKYTKILCWVNQKVKTEFINLSKDEFQIVFTDNYEDFMNKISDDTYLVVSLSIAHKNLKMLETLLQNFPAKRFNIILDSKHLFIDILPNSP